MRFLIGPAAYWLQAGLGVKGKLKRQDVGKKRAHVEEPKEQPR